LSIRESFIQLAGAWAEYHSKKRVDHYHPAYELVTVTLPEQLEQVIGPRRNFLVEGSTGKGNITAAPWFEINCSGRDAGGALCGNTRGRRVLWSALGSRSSVIFDLDQDGDQDIVTLEFNQPPLVLLSNLSSRAEINYINVKLNGRRSNRGGVGAVVKVYAGDDIYTKMNRGKSGYLSQSSYPLYFGLGSNTEIDKIEVSWPSGTTQVIDREIELNRLFEITEAAQ